jgi:hypothetical protein
MFAKFKTTCQRPINETHRSSRDRGVAKVFDSVPRQHRKGLSRGCGNESYQCRRFPFAPQGYGTYSDRAIQQDADLYRMPDHRGWFEIETVRIRRSDASPFRTKNSNRVGRGF